MTWEARHFGIKQRLTSKITKLEYPLFFQDEMVKGAFKSFIHKHSFKVIPDGTLMIEVIDYVSPFWILGKMVDYLFLENYMRKFLQSRNEILKVVAEAKE